MNNSLKIISLFGAVAVGLYFIPFKQKSFFELYPKDDDASKRLKTLYSHPVSTITTDGITWKYSVSGNGNKTILFLHGMGGSYDLWWQQILFFEKQYRVVSFTLPAEINSLAGAAEGILSILAQEKITTFIPVGTSMGGYIAQYLVNQYPVRIEKAVFSNTFPPNDIIKKENALKRIFIPLLPNFIAGKGSQVHLNNVIYPSSEKSELLRAFLLSIPFSKKGLSAKFDILTEFFEATPNQKDIARIPKLIFESDNDPMLDADLRNQLKKLYPQAQVHTFHNKGHFPYVNDAEEYNAVLKSFLEK